VKHNASARARTRRGLVHPRRTREGATDEHSQRTIPCRDGAAGVTRREAVIAFVRPSALSLCVVLSMSACSPTVLREMPATGTIPTGHIVYVDDGGCPLGQVKEVTGGSLTPDIPRRIRCVDYPTTAPTMTPERRSEIAAAAQACLREHPTVERYQVDRFGRVTATYRMAGGQTADTAPFFACVGARQSARARPAPESSGRWPGGLSLDFSHGELPRKRVSFVRFVSPS
jgi:Family of unknown function (DUF6719)